MSDSVRGKSGPVYLAPCEGEIREVKTSMVGDVLLVVVCILLGFVTGYFMPRYASARVPDQAASATANAWEDGVLWGGLASDLTQRRQGYLSLDDRLALARKLRTQNWQPAAPGAHP